MSANRQRGEQGPKGGRVAGAKSEECMHFLEAPTRLFTSTRLRPSCTFHIPVAPARCAFNARVSMSLPLPLSFLLSFSIPLPDFMPPRIMVSNHLIPLHRSRSILQTQLSFEFYSKRGFHNCSICSKVLCNCVIKM